MLQSTQLEHVLACYRDDIGTVRRLLVRASLPLDSYDSMPAVVEKLESSRSFRRDLSLNVISMAQMGGQHVSPADLLGIVALAAAGIALAPSTDEAVAHKLLQFVMEVCNRHEAAKPPRKSRYTVKRVAVVAVCVVLIAFGILLWQAESDTVAPVATEINFPQVVAPRRGAPVTIAQSDSQPSIRERATGRIPQIRKMLGRFLPRPNDSEEDADTAPAPIFRTDGSTPSRSSIGASPSTSSAGSFAPRSMAPSTVTADPTTFRGTPPAVPTALLSQRLGARSIPADAYAEDRSYDARYPRLLRRQPQTALSEEGELLASNEPGPVVRESTSAAYRASAAGIVRPVSLGIMAGNIVYSPAPNYPAAASAAHVQGQVKVQAEIDRDGNVASARVISGPPLLRDAAVGAVQQWRYRPYLSAGRPVSMSAVAVMDFELP